jgi:carbon monoxide dehydrogenase subunit G
VIARAAFVLAIGLLAPAASADGGTRVEVVKQGEVYVVDAALDVAVPIAEAFAVLTDFDRMARFVPNLTESRVRSREGSRVWVEQKGVARFGLLRFPFDSVREIDLAPDESVRSRQLSGAARAALSLTRFSATGASTQIRYHAEVDPGFWLPAWISRRLIEHEVRAQFDAIAAEMLRRHSEHGAAVTETRP